MSVHPEAPSRTVCTTADGSPLHRTPADPPAIVRAPLVPARATSVPVPGTVRG